MTTIRFLCILALGWLTACTRPNVATRPLERESESEMESDADRPVEAARYRYERRLSADGTMPANAMMTAKAHRDRMLACQNDDGGIAGSDSPQWTWIGPGNIGGRIRAILIHPTQPDIMYVGSAGGGIWKSIDGGASWFVLDDYLPSLAIGCMAMDPANPDVLYAGSGEGFFETEAGSSNTAAIRGAGIFKSINAGATWSQLPSTGGGGPEWEFVNRIAIDPHDSQIVLAATGAGVFRSVNGGTSWSQVATGYIYDLQFHPTDSSRLVAAPHDTPPLYSLDGGITWSSATGVSAHRIELRYAPSNPSVVYAAAAIENAGNTVIKVYRSVDGGKTYQLRTTSGTVTTYEAYSDALWVDPTNVDTIVVGGIFHFRSTNGGITLTPQFWQTDHADQHVIINHPGFNGRDNRTVYFGSDGGVHRTDNIYGDTCAPLNSNLGITQFYGAASNSNGVIFGGTQDNGTLRYNGDPHTWQVVLDGDGGFCAADPTNPAYLYGMAPVLGLFRSSDSGQTTSYIFQGITDAGGDANFISHFTLDPNNPNRMLVAARRLWRSDNVKAAAPTWSIVKPSIEPPDSPDGGGGTDPHSHFMENSPYNISTIAVTEGDPNRIWVGYNNGQVWKTIDGTAVDPTWIRVDANGPGGGLPHRWISRIVIDRINHDRVYVAIMGWEHDNLWRTVDSGNTWTDISGDDATGLPPAPVSALAQHRSDPNRLYAGTDVGVFTSSNDGVTWQAQTGGPGNAPIDELVWEDDQTLIAVTHGRGIYLGDVTAQPTPGDINADGAVNIDDLLAVIGAWGVCPSKLPCPADIAPPPGGNGNVNVDDLLMVINNWS